MPQWVERGRNSALEVAIVFMLVSGVSPFVSFGLSVEHLPYGIAVAVLAGRRPPLAFVAPVAIAAVFWVASIFYWGDWGNWIYLVQFINVLTPLVFFHTVRPQLERTARWVFWAFIAFGVMQFAGLLAWAEPFLDNFIPRFRGGRAPGYRGVSSLESEPARAGFQLLMLFIIGRSKFRSVPVALGVLLLAELLIVRATSGLILTAAFVGFVALHAIRANPKFAPVLLIGLVVVAGLAYATNPKIEEIVDTTVDGGFQGFEDSLIATSGGRYLGLKHSISDIVRQPFGRGADPSYAGNEITLLEEERYEAGDGLEYKIEETVRPVSAILNAMRTFGVAMAVLVAWAIRREIFGGRRPNLTPYFWFVILSALIYGPSGSEALVIALGIAGLDSTTPPTVPTDTNQLEPAL